MIVPRWEWRTFQAPFGEAERVLASLTPDREERSDERYLLSLDSDASIKVRDRRVDVKRRLAVDEHGLEQWLPILKSAWPLSGDEAREVLSAAGQPAELVTRHAYEPQEFLDELVTPNSSLLALPVSKHRRHYAFRGCMTELSELRVGEQVARTLAIESEDRAGVLAAVAALGLDERPVVCVAAGLKALVGFRGQRFAVIDVGTNSVKFHVASQRGDGSWEQVADRAEVTRLGEELERTGRLGVAPSERTIAAIAGMAAEAREHGAREIAVVGTAALRIASDAAEFVAALRDRTGLTVEVLSGEDEARLAFEAARAGVAVDGRLVVFDTGGGSSQFSIFDGARFSVNVGAVSVTERFGLRDVVSAERLATVLTALAGDLGALAGHPAPDAVIGMGGAVTNLAAISLSLATYDPDVIQGTVLRVEEIDRQLARLRTLTTAQRREIVGLQPNRAEVILAGACIVRTVLAQLGCDALTVSDRGLRHGVLAERFGRAQAGPVPDLSRR